MPSFYAFIRDDVVRKHGLDPGVCGPWEAINLGKQLPEDTVIMIPMDKDHPLYKELDNDPRYTKRVVSGN